MIIPELGHFFLVLAGLLALTLGLLPLYAAQRYDTLLMRTAPFFAHAQFIALLGAFSGLMLAFAQDDFSVQYVAQHSNSQLPLGYKLSAVWGGHEGSMLLWVTLLAGWTSAVALRSNQLSLRDRARVLAILGLISTGLLTFILGTSNPFDRLLPNFPLDGQDLNPLLQDIGLILHPPVLYMGYVGFSVVFAFALATLMNGRSDPLFIRWVRPWTLAAWAFLSVGITLGSWWAYYELGWGGWWFWDPVENASFMPWLAGLALLHSLAVMEKRQAFNRWGLLLAIITFSLCVLGTFLVRSGILTSVHAFATDPARGLFILWLLGLLTGSSLLLFLWRSPHFSSAANYRLFSRESMLLGNNLLLMTALSVVFIGTLFPLLFDVLEWGKISVGPPYFNTLFVPLVLVIMGLMGLGIHLRWQQDQFSRIRPTLRLLAVLSLGISGLLLVTLETQQPILLFCSLLAMAWLSTNTLFPSTNMSPLNLWNARSRLGMHLAHLGVVACAAGILGVSFYSIERDVRLSPGQHTTLADYRVEFTALNTLDGPNYQAHQGVFTLSRHNQTLFTLKPENRRYPVRGIVTTEAAIHPTLGRDVYISLGESLNDSDWSVRLYYKPFVRWIWLGGLLMALGALLAMSDKRYRRRRCT
jgi:cytochrome c-type biogenesis protein CcmF